MAESSGDIFGPINAETGDLTQFDSTRSENSATLTADSGNPNEGTYSFKYSFDGSSDDLSGNITVSDETEGYFRFYVYVDSSFEMGGYSQVDLAILHDGSDRLVEFCVYNNSATEGNPDRWRVLSSDTVFSGDFSATNFSLDAWHRAEIYWKAGTGADGEVEVWVDGTSIVSESSLNLSAYAIDNFRAGTYEFGTDPVNGSIFYIDDIKANTTGPIGAYAESGASVPIMLHHYKMAGGL